MHQLDAVPRITVKPITISSRRLSQFAAAAAVAVVFTGFARTYYLKFAFDTPSLSLLLHVHGAVMTCWIALFVAQVTLVARHRVDLHRRLGFGGVALAVLVVATGAAVAIEHARRVYPARGVGALSFLMFPLSVVAVFALMFGIAVALRRNKETHRRVMLLATLSLVTPALSRFPTPSGTTAGPLVAIGGTVALMIACVVYDTVANRRLHPAFRWAMPLLIPSYPLRVWLSQTDGWHRVAAWIVS